MYPFTDLSFLRPPFPDLRARYGIFPESLLQCKHSELLNSLSLHQAPISDSKKRLALAIIDFLSTSLKDGTLASEDAESIEVAQSCIAETFHVDPTDQTALKDAIGGQSLLSIYGVYEKLKGKSTTSTASANANAPPQSAASSSTSNSKATATSSPSSSTPTNPEAEAFKSQGNAAMQQKDYPAAIDFYSKAISLSPTNPIYLSNRAAAYSACHKHAEAQTDAELAVAADPKYTKAWSRLGLARFVLGDVKGSVEAYGKGIEYEGNGGSDAMKKGYKTAKERLEQQEREKEEAGEDLDDLGSARGPGGAGAGAGGGAGGGMPDFSALAGMLGGGRGGGGGGGGGPDLSSIMSNPMFASMAQNLMRNPDAMNNLMNNPQLRQMAENFGLGGGGGGGAAGGRPAGGTGAGAGGAAGSGAGAGGGGGGGMPDLASLMQDPSIAEL